MQLKPMADIRRFFEEYASLMDIEVVDVEWNDREAALTVFIETDGGVDLDTCEKFHNSIMDPIDVLDPTFGKPYTLNVSSPGLDRPFKTARDFERNLNKEVEVKLFAPLKGKKLIEGVLLEYDGNSVTLKTEKEQLKIALNKIAKINKAISID